MNKEIKQETNWVRLMDGMEDCELIGKEFEVMTSHYNSQYVELFDDGTAVKVSKSDVRFLTPMIFEGKHIAIGDEIDTPDDWQTVTGFYSRTGKIYLITGLTYYGLIEIKAHRTGLEKEIIGTELETTINGKVYISKIIREK